MTDENFAPFPFMEKPPMFEDPKPADPPAAKTRKRRAPPSAAKPVKPRKKRAPPKPADSPAVVSETKTQRRVGKSPLLAAPYGKKTPRGIKLDLATVMPALVGLKEDDARLFGQMAIALQNINKAGRARIVAALGRLFA